MPIDVTSSNEKPASNDDPLELLTRIFKQGPMRQWAVEDIAKDKIMRFAQAYLLMAGAGYRPEAPSDGFGNIQLSHEQCRDRTRLYVEAATYALRFNRDEDNDRDFHIGCSNYDTNRAFVLSIEAARVLASGIDDPLAIKLLKLASREIEQNKRKRTSAMVKSRKNK